MVLTGCAGSVTIRDDGSQASGSWGDLYDGATGGPSSAIPGTRGAGAAGGGTNVAATGGALCAAGAEVVFSTPARRLSHVEYNRTVQALFPWLSLPTQEFAADLSIHGFENDAAALHASATLLDQYSSAAGRIAELAAENPEELAPCMKSPDMACAKQFIGSFGRKVFRRPLSAEEQGRYEALFTRFGNEISFQAALQLTLDAFLQSPQFLYRLELGSGNEAAGAKLALDDYAMASRLSYFLWQSMPDDELLDEAEAGRLRTKDQVAAQARRMLQAAPAEKAFVDFHRQWLGLDRVLDENKDPDLFPAWSDGLRDAIRRESDLLIAHVFREGGGSVEELLTTRVSFVNRPLAELYEVSATGADWANPVMLPQGERAGLLTRANFLAGWAHTTNGSPPLRGVAVLDQLLCQPPGAPPANANVTPPVVDPKMVRTNRQLFEERTGSGECQSCHKTINGIGYGFEAYDSIGRHRATENGVRIDARGQLLGTDVDGAFNGAVELSQKLGSSGQVQYCAARKWVRYAFGREDDAADACLLETLNKAMASNDGDMRELLVQIATSYPFMHRAAAAP